MQKHQIITNEILLNSYLTPPMESYFYKKLQNENKDYVKLKICEILKFLMLGHYTFGDIPFNSELDDVWHLWILQTIQYQQLMDTLPGKKFIHHCSKEYVDSSTDEQQNNEEELNRQISFLSSYIKNFGGFTDESSAFWPMTQNLMQALGLNLNDLNKYLLELAD